MKNIKQRITTAWRIVIGTQSCEPQIIDRTVYKDDPRDPEKVQIELSSYNALRLYSLLYAVPGLNQLLCVKEIVNQFQEKITNKHIEDANAQEAINRLMNESLTIKK